MHALLRATLLAFAFLQVASILHAQPADLPPIFALRPAPPPATASKSTRVMAPMVSERVRNAITSAATHVLAEAKAFDSPKVPVGATTSFGPASGNTVMMDQFVVKATPLRLTPLPPRDPPLLKFIKTGTLYHQLHGKVDVEIYLHIGTIGMISGLDRGREFTRTEIGFSFSW